MHSNMVIRHGVQNVLIQIFVMQLVKVISEHPSAVSPNWIHPQKIF